MKTDDDAFVRVDEILTSMDRIKVNHGLLYGLINSDSQPHRNPESKWYISPEVIAYDFFSSYAYICMYYTQKNNLLHCCNSCRNGQKKIILHGHMVQDTLYQVI